MPREIRLRRTVSECNVRGAMTDDILRRAIDAAGGPTKLAKALGVTHSAVSHWTRVPAERVLAVAKASGIAPHLLRPDIYPPPGEAAA